ncbi:MAG: endo alpha-1,4 polygalactosaminidase [Thiohalocapsa sp.]|nr:endo alpha-1,4 polygalactosaminidase [Thiohalocapsa sp.]MCF7991870.1 endo alpha-1,4 polygalactosaminidase [Thiohalocapsa sp.]
MSYVRHVRLAAYALPALIALPVQALDLHPVALAERDGRNGGQSLSVLATKDQSGSDDNWYKYLELYPDDGGYRGDFSFRLPDGLNADAIDALTLVVNYRGPERDQQRWRWRLRNVADNRWVTLGDNRIADSWVWAAPRFFVPGDPRDYVDGARKLHLRYVTDSSYDASQMDYLKLVASMDGDGSPRVPQPPTDPPTDPPNNQPDNPPTEPPVVPGQVWQPAPGTSWQWQLTGRIDTGFDVDMYNIDLNDVSAATIADLHAAGRVVVCYFSAGSWENWRPDADRFPAAVKGRSNGWPGEQWLDIRRIDLLGPIMEARLDLARSKGCDGVEPDNVDGYSNNTGFPLRAEHQLAYNRWLAEAAHARALSVGLKNNVEQAAELEPWFDWALNEQCFQYNECGLLEVFIRAGKAVFGVEYSGDPAKFCPKANAMDMDWLVKDMDLGPKRLSCRDAY